MISETFIERFKSPECLTGPIHRTRRVHENCRSPAGLENDRFEEFMLINVPDRKLVAVIRRFRLKKQ